MQGLHLTGDLFDCSCTIGLLTDLETLSTLCRDATNAAGLTIVDDKYHVFPDFNGEPGGITGAILLAESHLAVHTWPELGAATTNNIRVVLHGFPQQSLHAQIWSWMQPIVMFNSPRKEAA